MFNTGSWTCWPLAACVPSLFRCDIASIKTNLSLVAPATVNLGSEISDASSGNLTGIISIAIEKNLQRALHFHSTAQTQIFVSEGPLAVFSLFCCVADHFSSFCISLNNLVPKLF
jgi:hypothetical protein